MVGFVSGILVYAYPVTSEDSVVGTSHYQCHLNFTVMLLALGCRNHATILTPESKDFGVLLLLSQPES